MRFRTSLQTTPRHTRGLTRRALLAGGAALAMPSIVAAQSGGEVDVIIVGAGAAGIAAARRVAAAGRRFVLVEATERIGGRCITDTRTFGVPFDRGAHWIYSPDINPLAKLARSSGLDIEPAPTAQKLRLGRRNARPSELENFLAALVRSNRAIAEAARAGDRSAAQALPRDLGELRPTIEFMIGAYTCGKPLREVSALDLSRWSERDTAAFCPQGFGALLAKLGAGLPVQLNTAVTRVDSGASRVEVRTGRGTITGRSAIVTASTDVLAAGKIRFDPELPKRQLDALRGLKLGSFDHIALELPDNPLGLTRDDFVIEQADSERTAALLGNVSGSAVALVEVGGSFGRELAGQGEAAMVNFARGWLGNLYGADVRRAVGRSAATRWNEQPWTLGAFSVAAPGAQGARKILMEPLRERVFFAGEAVHETLCGTVAGAWESGERAAEAALRKLGVLKEPEQAKPKRPARKKR